MNEAVTVRRRIGEAAAESVEREDIVTTIKAFIKRHPVLTYYALVFAISWGGILLIVGGPGGIPGSREQVETLIPFVLLALFAGPSVAGLLMTGLSSGRAGLRDFSSPVAPVAGGRSLVRGRAPDRPAPGDGGAPSRSRCSRRTSSPASSRPTTRSPCCCSVSGGGFSVAASGGARLDGVRRAQAEAAVRALTTGLIVGLL